MIHGDDDIQIRLPVNGQGFDIRKPGYGPFAFLDPDRPGYDIIDIRGIRCAAHPLSPVIDKMF